MKITHCLLIACLLCSASTKANGNAYTLHSGMNPRDTAKTSIAVTLVQQQLDGYNARDIEAFLAPYSDSVEIYEYPNMLMVKGKNNMRGMYADLFKQVPNLHCKLENRIVLNNTVIDHENVTGFGPNPVYAIAVYTIEGNKISKVRFIQ